MDRATLSAGPTTVASFPDAVAAHLARVRLEQRGIEAFVLDEQIVTANPFYAGAVGGVRLAVAPGDAQAAADVLAERPAPRERRPSCPACDATELRFEPGPRRSTLFALLSCGLTLLRARDRFTCTQCGHAWRE